VDADETVGSLHMLFSLPREVAGLGSLRRGDLAPERLLVEVAPGLHLCPGGGGGVEATLALAAAERRMLLRRVAALYDRYDAVVVDGGSRLDSVMASCAATSGRLVCVTTRDPIAQAAAYALVKVARARFEGLPVELLVNRAAEEEGRVAHDLVDVASATFEGRGVPFAGAVLDDEALVRTVDARVSLAGLSASSPAADALAGLADRLLVESSPQAGSRPLPLVR
jgi:MinD-like ATPase involved in chromosome partitioning or flagellar assembly